MNSHFQKSFLLLSLFLVFGCKSVAAADEMNVTAYLVADYLLEAKNCFATEGDRTPHTKRLMKKVGVEDYHSYRFKLGDKPKLTLTFGKNQGDESFAMSLVIDLNKEKGCDRFSVFEIVP